MRSRIFLTLVLAFIATLSLNAFAQAQGGPTPVTDLRAEISGTSVILTWTHTDVTVDHYEVWWSDNPYGVPGDDGVVHIKDVTSPASLNDPVTYTDTASGVGNHAVNSYYFIRGIDGGGVPSVPSNRAGEFDFGLNEPVALPVVDHCGTISADENWGPNYVHKLTCEVTVSTGVKLTLGRSQILNP